MEPVESSELGLVEKLLRAIADESRISTLGYYNETWLGRDQNPGYDIRNIFYKSKIPETQEVYHGKHETFYFPTHSMLISEYFGRRGRTFGFGYFQTQARGMAGDQSEELAIALEEFQEGRAYPHFGTEFLRDFVKQGADVPEDELRRYGLQLDMKHEYGSGYVFEGRAFDATFNFCLTYDGELIASVGFDAHEGRAFIRQIQGPNKSASNREQKVGKLKTIKWERALVQYAVQFAEQYGIPEVALQSSQNNAWAYVRNEHGHMLYDVTAQRCGFKISADGNYVKQIAVPMPVLV